jgi:hypothetical protein
MLWCEVHAYDRLDPRMVCEWMECADGDFHLEEAADWMFAGFGYADAMSWQAAGWHAGIIDEAKEWFEAFPSANPAELLERHFSGDTVAGIIED